MLDIQGLPKNANGFRTTHTCELCGFEPKTKNKYREKQDHLVMKHFKERIDKIFPHCRPYSCPNTECSFEGKDKQALLRHYTGKHGVLELYLREALMAKGINYHLSDSAKRKSMNNPASENARAGKMARMSPEVPVITEVHQTVIPAPLIPSPLGLPPSPDSSTAILPSEYSEQTIVYSTTSPPLSVPVCSPAVTAISQAPSIQTQLRLPTVPTTKLPSMSTLTNKTKPVQLEVDALIASFEPHEYQVAGAVYNPSPLVREDAEQPIGSQIVSSTTLDFPNLFLPVSEADPKMPLILDNNIMWSSGSTAISVDTAQTVPHVFDTCDSGFINLGDIEYDYLYPATVDPSIVQTHSSSSSSTSPSSQTVLPFTDL